MRRTIRVPALVAAILAVLAVFGGLEAQVPTLNPEQTVNTATGEMGISLPLGTVNGVNGLDFPVMLYYKSGIHYNQPSSDVGLGFSTDAGMITRKVVYVPDDNNGGYGIAPPHKVPVKEACSAQNAKFFVEIAISWGIGMFAQGFGKIGPMVLDIYGAANRLYGIYQAFQPALFGSSQADYRSIDNSGYDWYGNTGKGFFKQGEGTDVPDIYFVSTPYISGEIIWVGDPATGHFVFKRTGGSALKGDETIKITYNYLDGFASEYFIIELPDGKRLVFSTLERGGNSFRSWAWGKSVIHDPFWPDYQCGWTGATMVQSESSPSKWYLTAVLDNTYQDGGGNANDPLDAGAKNSGAWIAFKYSRVLYPAQYEQVENELDALQRSGGTNASVTCWSKGGSDCYFQQLAGIETPNEKAEYIYSDPATDPRLDNLYTHETNYDVYVHRGRLDAVAIKTRNNELLRKILFKTSYTLAPGSRHSYSRTDDASGTGYWHPLAGNQTAACLTLDSVLITDCNVANNYKVDFEYGKNPDASLIRGELPALVTDILNGPEGQLEFNVEQRDIWGYYKPKSAGTNENDFNRRGQINGALDADAWSLTDMELPGGMKLTWAYEPHRYDRVNGEIVSSVETASPMAPRYGGGIRVKTLIIDGKIGKPDNLTYFYTDENGNFTEINSNSSGYASVEPPRAQECSLTNSDHVKGGMYTPSKVAYEKVQVVRNYRMATPHAPDGYTVYDITHAGNKIVPGYYPNAGKYGEIDNSWKRGLLRSVSQFNKSGKCIQSRHYNYEFIVPAESQQKLLIGNFHLLSSTTLDKAAVENSSGWVKNTEIIDTINKVSKATEYKYADNSSVTPDKKTSIVRDIRKIYGDIDGGIYFSGARAYDNHDRIATAVFDLPGTDPDKPDMLVGVWRREFCVTALYLLADIDTNNSFEPESIDYVGLIGTPSLNYMGPMLTGIQVVPDAGDPDQLDAVIMLVNSGYHYFEFDVCHNIGTGNIKLSSNYTHYTSNGFYVPPELQDNQNESYNVTTTVICTIDNNVKWDLLFYNSRPGKSKRLYAYLNGSLDNARAFIKFDNSTMVATDADVPELKPVVDNQNELNNDLVGPCFRMKGIDPDGKNDHLVYIRGKFAQMNDRYKIDLYYLKDITVSGSKIIVPNSAVSVDNFSFGIPRSTSDSSQGEALVEMSTFDTLINPSGSPLLFLVFN